MTIQFNLLPDIKVQYLKAKRQKHLVVLASVSASLIAVAVFVILLTTVFVLQKKNISDLDKDIKSSSGQLQSVEDLKIEGGVVDRVPVQRDVGALEGCLHARAFLWQQNRCDRSDTHRHPRLREMRSANQGTRQHHHRITARET